MEAMLYTAPPRLVCAALVRVWLLIFRLSSPPKKGPSLQERLMEEGMLRDVCAVHSARKSTRAYEKERTRRFEVTP